MSMRRTRVIPLHSRFHRGFRRRIVDTKSLLEALQTHSMLVFLAVFLLFGTVLGSLFARKASVAALGKLDFIFYSDFQTRAVQSPASVFTASLGSAFLFIFICFLLGLSLWGMFLIPAIPFFRGFGLGLTAGYLYAAYGFQGVLFHAVVILPGAFLCMISILLAAREGILFSKKIASCSIAAEKGSVVSVRLRSYLTHFGSVMILAFASAVVDLVTTVCFAGAFSF